MKKKTVTKIVTPSEICGGMECSQTSRKIKALHPF